MPGGHGRERASKVSSEANQLFPKFAASDNGTTHVCAKAAYALGQTVHNHINTLFQRSLAKWRRKRIVKNRDDLVLGRAIFVDGVQFCHDLLGVEQLKR